MSAAAATAMSSQKYPGALTAPALRNQHKRSNSSLGSLYEVLADLDDNQLHYLIQEMNHTGHQNVSVSQGITAFESPHQRPDSFNMARASTMPAQPLGLQRQLSKSQRGKLRVQTAFQKTPSSSRLRPRQEEHSAPQPADHATPQTPKQEPVRDQADAREPSKPSPTKTIQESDVRQPAPGQMDRRAVSNPAPPRLDMSVGQQPTHSQLNTPTAPTYPPAQVSLDNGDRHAHDQANMSEASSQPPAQVSVRDTESRAPVTQRPRKQSISSVYSIASTVASPTPSREGNRRKPLSYKRIPRPEFNLPPNVTITDLLRLLEMEFHSSSSQRPPSSNSYYATSSTVSSYPPPSPLFLSPDSPMSSPDSPGRRSLRSHSSRLNMALEADRAASGVEEIGLGMLEPRPMAASSIGISGTSTPATMESFDWGFKGEVTPPRTPVVLEGIFDVLENR